jgi:hypothetical protein
VGVEFEFRALNWQRGAVLLEPHLLSILLWLFWRWGLTNYLLRLASNNNPPNLSLPSSQNYRSKPPAPGTFYAFFKNIIPNSFFSLFACHFY